MASLDLFSPIQPTHSVRRDDSAMIAAILLAVGLTGLTLPQPVAPNIRTHGLASSSGVGTQAVPPSRLAVIRAAAPGSASLVYVADANDNAIYVYNNVPNAQPIQVITQGLHTPMGLCVDSAGNLYVANNAFNTVLVYAPGATTPFRTYSTGLTSPTDVKVSLSGAVYVTNQFFTATGVSSDVVEYPPNSVTPSWTWQSPVPNSKLVGLALQTPDASITDVYVSYESYSGNGGLLWCPVGSTTCLGTGISTPGTPTYLAFQYGTFPLTLASSFQTFPYPTNNSFIDVYHLHHGTAPAVLIPTPGGAPGGIAFDRSFGHLFAANEMYSASGSFRTGTLDEYDYPSGILVQRFPAPASATLPWLTGVAVYPSATL